MVVVGIGDAARLQIFWYLLGSMVDYKKKPPFTSETRIYS